MKENRLALLTESVWESGSRKHIKLSGLRGIAKYPPGSVCRQPGFNDDPSALIAASIPQHKTCVIGGEIYPDAYPERMPLSLTVAVPV